MNNIREIILKKLFNRIKESKRNNLKEVRIPIKELEDLGAVIHEMLVEFYNIKMNDKTEVIDNTEEDNSLEISGGTW